MASSVRRLVRDLTPPVITRAIDGRAKGALRFVDGYATWGEASEAATGYSETSIVDQVIRATDAVIAGRAAFERDGVTFDRIEYRWPVAGAMLWQAARHGRLRVLDFGGSLGSSMRQMGPLLDGVDVCWGVVEQPVFVEAGRRFESERLRFFGSVEECVTELQPTIALLSGVLQYVPDPHAILSTVRDSGVEVILIDRTPMQDGTTDIPVVQQVPAEIYEASYPAWLLSASRLLEDLPGWSVVDTFPGIEANRSTTGGIAFDWRGLLLTRN